jgi:hypothetical protein
LNPQHPVILFFITDLKCRETQMNKPHYQYVVPMWDDQSYQGGAVALGADRVMLHPVSLSHYPN